MICELCGSDVPRTKLVMVEGAAVGTCPNCEKYASSGAVKTKEGKVSRSKFEIREAGNSEESNHESS